ncbi:response regulator transcription factor [Permianibacter aggregans]|uniref:LuxR family two component transcriptional regulator n=1 Tax=Permianibacter aggregans TaxID=1510150 RepID=A0A4R6UJ26_9GAMM|nr:response regulator transcription factor [Permianibacter aggregans]QGX41244.1 response regulator transcription factor [Permianibacter aggregans]TDQ43194.1 LuxR family two component transcriptional regulator [Permianibacter aggregans]
MKVLLADDHPLFRDALKRAIEFSIEQAEVFDADSVAALYALLEQHSDADLLLLDLHMPGAKGFSALIHIRAAQPGLPVIVISGNEDPAIMQRAIGHGASAYIPKNTAPETMSSAIRAVLDGEVWLPAGIDDKTTSIAQEEAEIARRIKELTPHQFRVLMMLADGSLNKQIAYDLGVSEATVKAHMTAIMKKLGVTNRTQAVVAASRLQIEPNHHLIVVEDE